MYSIKTTILLLLLPSVFFIAGCKKKSYAALVPQVQFVSVAPYDSNSVLLTGQVTNIGGSDIEYTGFSYSQSPNFDITENQMLLNGSNGTFITTVVLAKDSTYYFKAFAANANSYGVSSTVKYTVPDTL